MAIQSINPTTGKVLQTFQPLSPSQIETKPQLAACTAPKFQRLGIEARAGMMSRAAELLESEKENFARMMTAEMGKTFRSAIDEVAKCALSCRHYARIAGGHLADENIESKTSRNFVRYQ